MINRSALVTFVCLGSVRPETTSMVVCVSYVYFRKRKKKYSFIPKRGRLKKVIILVGFSEYVWPMSNTLEVQYLEVCQAGVLCLCFQTEVLYESVEHNAVNVL